MATRSLTRFIDQNDEEVCVLYRHFDGMPDTHGKELKDFLKTLHPDEVYHNIAHCIKYFNFRDRGDGGQFTAVFPACFRGYDAEYLYTVKRGRVTHEKL